MRIRCLWLLLVVGFAGCLTGRPGLQHAPTPTQKPASARENLSNSPADGGTKQGGKPRPTAKDLSQPKAQ